MKLIKISSDHYVIVDDNKDIEENDYTLKKGQIRQVSFLMQDNGHVITHSTYPIEYTQVDMRLIDDGVEGWCYDKIKPLSLSEVKELLGEVDVEALARKHHYNDTIEGGYLVGGFINGYNQALEDNKDRKYTEEDMRNVYRHGTTVNVGSKEHFNIFIQSIQPKTQWEVEFIDGKLKLI